MEQRYFSDWIDAFLEGVKDTEAPSRFKLWSAISLIASALGRKVWVQWDGPLYPNMYIILVGPAGSMKGTAMRIPKKLLTDLELPVASDATTREQFINELADARRHFTYNNEQIWHSSLTVFSKEFNVIVNETNRSLIINLIDWFDCDDDFTYKTKTSGNAQASGVFLNIVGAITPDLLAQSMPPESRGSGFISRTHFIYADEKEQIIYLPTDIDQELYQKLLHDLDLIAFESGPFVLAESFKAPWRAFVDEVMANPPFAGTVLESYDNRLRIHIIKLCMILNASRGGNKVITDEDLYKAISINEEARKHMLKAFIGMGTAKNSQFIPIILREVERNNVMKFSDLFGKMLNDISKQDLIDLIAGLKAAKKIDTIQVPNEMDFYIFLWGQKQIVMESKKKELTA